MALLLLLVLTLVVLARSHEMGRELFVCEGIRGYLASVLWVGLEVLDHFLEITSCSLLDGRLSLLDLFPADAAFISFDPAVFDLDAVAVGACLAAYSAASLLLELLQAADGLHSLGDIKVVETFPECASIPLVGQIDASLELGARGE